MRFYLRPGDVRGRNWASRGSIHGVGNGGAYVMRWVLEGKVGRSQRQKLMANFD